MTGNDLIVLTPWIIFGAALAAVYVRLLPRLARRRLWLAGIALAAAADGLRPLAVGPLALAARSWPPTCRSHCRWRPSAPAADAPA